VYATQLLPALQQGAVSLQALRAAAARALLPRFRTGLYDDPALVPWSAIPASVIESPAHHALARRAARQSYVLLKNEGGLLPLLPVAQGGPARIALVGPTSNCSACGVGRYSGHPATAVGILQGLSAAAAAAGSAVVFGGEELTPGAIAALQGADVGVLVLTGTAEGESQDRFDIGFPAATQAWLAALAAAPGLPPLVLLGASGGAVDCAPALPLVRSALAIYTGGMEYGAAVADVLYGVEDASGVLAHTIYRQSWINASDFLSMALRAPPGRGHRYLTPAARAEHVLFPFGSGGSYTEWEVGFAAAPLAISAADLRAGANVTLSLTLTNTGSKRVGSRVAYALLSRQGAEAPGEDWPVTWLPQEGFAKAHGVPPGGSVALALVLGARDFSRWDAAAHAFAVRPGAFGVAVRDCAEGAVVTVTA
jgi:beta-glucosidase